MKAQDLKNSILQLAIQGKLVEQRPEDGTAEELYQKIQAEKQKLIKEGKIKKEKLLPPITEDEIPFDIPETWKWVRISEISDLYTGNSIPKDIKEHKYSKCKAGYCYIGTKDIGFNQHIQYENGIKIPFDEPNFKFAYKHSILLCIEGGSAGRKIGYLEQTVCFGNKLCCINLFSVFYKYVFFMLQSQYFRRVFNEKIGGIIGGVSISNLKESIVPLPPLGEQKRIVAKIEELEPLINQYDQAEQELSALNDKFPEQLKKSILQYAFQGKLVAQDENDEPAEVLYAQIQAEKQKLIKEGKIKKEKPLPPINPNELPFDIPETWKWVRLSDLGLINPRNNIPDEKEVTFIPMNSLYSEISKTPNTNNKKIWKDLKKGYTHVAENDIILAKITPCFENGKSAILKNLINGFGGATTEVHVFRSLGHLNLKYVLLYLKSPIFMGYATKHMTGTAGQKRVPTEVFANYYFPLPPLEEQNRIVAKIDELTSSLNRLKNE